jgi:hypothetical protein
MIMAAAPFQTAAVRDSRATARKLEQAAADPLSRGVLRLPWLAPDITTPIINGQKSPKLTAQTLTTVFERLIERNSKSIRPLVPTNPSNMLTYEKSTDILTMSV